MMLSLVLLIGLATTTAWILSPTFRGGLRHLATRPPLAAVLWSALGLSVLLLLTDPPSELAFAFAVAAILAFLVLWVREFLGLMTLTDDAFPGRHDKLIWVALMVLLPPVGLASFSLFRRAYWPATEKPAPGRASELL